MAGVFWIKFPKPKKNLEKCQRWVRACGRENFTTDKVTRWTYICSKHFVGGNGPTTDYPDPIPATPTPNQVERFSRKRKALTPRATTVPKKLLMEVAEVMVSLQDNPPLPDSSSSDVLINSQTESHDVLVSMKSLFYHRPQFELDSIQTWCTLFSSDIQLAARLRNTEPYNLKITGHHLTLTRLYSFSHNTY
ncbi:hypothetical protein ACJMK2_007383 [Sinanodonta woodiana]|uniref:THAP-type domain-containing protein n=1 Tax=Sinanodonta woodiana TaxID=1069815 RepID=A0ABD3VID8_SINWO